MKTHKLHKLIKRMYGIRLYCGAKTRQATPCKRKPLANGRCPNHGGMSTGPRTVEGKQKCTRNLPYFRNIK